MVKFSIIIPCLNEEKNLRELLPLLVGQSDDIILVDSGSTDKSVELAKSFHLKLLQQEFINYADNKNRAILKSLHEWVLLLDADERPDLLFFEEIHKILNLKEEYKAYWIRRNTFIGAKRIYYSGVQKDKVIRFFKKGFAYYPPVTVHEEMRVDGKIGFLQSRLNHYTAENFEQFEGKIDKYARLLAVERNNQNLQLNLYHFYLKPFFRLFKHFIIQAGFLDGKTGWQFSLAMAKGVRKRYVFMNEMKKTNLR